LLYEHGMTAHGRQHCNVHHAHGDFVGVTSRGGPAVADRRQLIERVFDVVHQRLEQAEKIGLQKLDQIEQQGIREFEKTRQTHDKKLRRIATKRRRAHARQGRRHRSRQRDDHDAEVEPRSRRASATTGSAAAGKLTRDEKRAYRLARRRANWKLLFYTHFTCYLSVLMLILLTTRSIRVVAIVALSWGIALFLHYFWALVAPTLREQWIQKEVGERVDANVSSERKQAETRHVRSLENLSASIAHEIRNPITAAKSLVQQMGEDPISNANIEYASVALDELDRVERSISHLLRYARDEDLTVSSVSMADIVHSALDTFRDRINAEGVTLDLQLDTRGEMRGDSEKLRRVVINLVGNALDAMVDSHVPNPSLKLMMGDNLAGTEVWLRVQDNGPGIPDDTLSKIFDPFYTTKDQGTGLGLALSKKVVEAHGGRVEVDASPETGTEFVLSFPKNAEPGGDEQ
jgi:signal transduction histidine kinase